ncbi:MAG: SGNH/GDSL hydrolase family protein [Anaerolineae bacterium]|nr:SGNH/GDSL hydrolase family protein [Anaerolineae bacterium]
MYLVLLGDSIFDNGAYVHPGQPDVRAQVQRRLPAGDQAVLLAVDGSTVTTAAAQVPRIPAEATHLVLSVGGNDALSHLHLLNESANSVSEVLMKFSLIEQDFRRKYRTLLDNLRGLQRPLLVCTLYEPHFPDELIQRLAVTALALFNDAILREAAHARLPVLDLRQVFTAAAHYANPIEPSAAGGDRLAGAILHALHRHDFAGGPCTLYGAAP